MATRASGAPTTSICLLEGTSEVTAVSGPGDGFGPDQAASRASQTPDRTLDHRASPPDGEVPPLPRLLLEATTHLRAAHRTGQEPEATVDVDDEQVVFDLEPVDPKPWKVEKPVE